MVNAPKCSRRESVFNLSGIDRNEELTPKGLGIGDGEGTHSGPPTQQNVFECPDAGSKSSDDTDSCKGCLQIQLSPIPKSNAALLPPKARDSERAISPEIVRESIVGAIGSSGSGV